MTEKPLTAEEVAERYDALDDHGKQRISIVLARQEHRVASAVDPPKVDR